MTKMKNRKVKEKNILCIVHCNKTFVYLICFSSLFGEGCGVHF